MSAPNGESAGGESAVVRTPMVRCPVTNAQSFPQDAIKVLLETKPKYSSARQTPPPLPPVSIALTSHKVFLNEPLGEIHRPELGLAWLIYVLLRCVFPVVFGFCKTVFSFALLQD